MATSTHTFLHPSKDSFSRFLISRLLDPHGLNYKWPFGMREIHKHEHLGRGGEFFFKGGLDWDWSIVEFEEGAPRQLKLIKLICFLFVHDEDSQ